MGIRRGQPDSGTYVYTLSVVYPFLLHNCRVYSSDSDEGEPLRKVEQERSKRRKVE